MTEKSVIIGAGIAGLSAGCYAHMNGYRTQVFDLHTEPGGLCTAGAGAQCSDEGLHPHTARAGEFL